LNFKFRLDVGFLCSRESYVKRDRRRFYASSVLYAELYKGLENDSVSVWL